MSIRSLLKQHHRMPVIDLRNQIDQLFDDFSTFNFPPTSDVRMSEDMMLSPKTDVTETDKSYQLHLEMPGITKEQLNIDLSGDVLTVKGEKKMEKENKGKDFHYVERRYGMYHRAFTLPNHVDKNAISAGFDNGVLMIEIPKIKEIVSNSRKIAIQKK